MYKQLHEVLGASGPPSIAVIRSGAPSATASATSLWYAGDHAQSFTNVRDCCARDVPVAAVVLDTPSAERAYDWLRELRQDPRLGHRPAYTTSELGPWVRAASDGPVPAPTRLNVDLEGFSARCQALARDEHPDDEGRFLAYLYLRPDLRIEPQLDLRHAGYYRYPLFDLFAPPNADGAVWGDSLRRRGLLESVKLIDRLRKCKGCGGSHLNYVDVCPECHEIDIGENIYLHCHTCGHVAPQESFVTRSGLACGKCTTKFRHIGVDYDRALECFGCSACSARFTEPEIEARCLQCAVHSATSELPELRVQSYRVTDAGKLAARHGAVSAPPATHDTQRNLTSSFFEQTLNWMLQLRQRHDDVQFGVAAIQVVNFEALAASVTPVAAIRLVEAFARRLRETIRTTDLIMRAGEHTWFLLSPQTDRAGLLGLMQSIETLAAATEQPDGSRIELAANCLTADQIRDVGVGANVVLAELHAGAHS